jgi:hypothetical protein
MPDSPVSTAGTGSGAAAADGSAPADARPLDDLMLAMDVVDTLRYRQTLVERELSAEDREQQLIARLREIYAAQGIDVPDHILAEGVAALAQDRFTYTPPRAGLAVTLARLYIHRHYWVWPIVGLVLFAALAVVGYRQLVIAPRQRQLREVVERASAGAQAVAAASQEAGASPRAKELADRVAEAARAENLQEARRRLDELDQLRRQLELEYELRIVAEGSTGVWRVPDVNPSSRNFYIIVQAVAPGGEVLRHRIKSEEDGRVNEVTKWGLRVDEATFQQIADDKQDDGIIQNNRFAIKRAGYLEPEYLIPTTGGAIIEW